MKRVSDIRLALSNIPGALSQEPDFEWRSRGDISVAWDPASQEAPETFAPAGTIESDGLIPMVEFAPEIEADTSRPLLGETAAEEIRRRTLVHGIEALAWYMPFHQTGYQWGCYLSISGILAISDVFLPLSLPAANRVELAIHSLLRHEAMHFGV